MLYPVLYKIISHIKLSDENGFWLNKCIDPQIDKLRSTKCGLIVDYDAKL